LFRFLWVAVPSQHQPLPKALVPAAYWPLKAANNLSRTFRGGARLLCELVQGCGVDFRQKPFGLYDPLPRRSYPAGQSEVLSHHSLAEYKRKLGLSDALLLGIGELHRQKIGFHELLNTWRAKSFPIVGRNWRHIKG